METPRGLRFQAFEKAFRNDLGETIVEIMAGTPGYLGSNRSEDLELHEEVEKAPGWPDGPEVGLGPCGELRRPECRLWIRGRAKHGFCWLFLRAGQSQSC